MRSVFQIAASSLMATLMLACSSAPTGSDVGPSEVYRYPSSVNGRSVEPKFCQVISGFSTKLSKSGRGIGMNECQHLISENTSVCEKFKFCDNKAASRADLAQNRARVNLLVATLNQGFAGSSGRIHNLSNFKFRAALKNPAEHIGFEDLVQAVATDTQLQAMR